LLFLIGFSLALYFFYFKYVPIVKPFQMLLVPILVTVFILTLVNTQWGTLFFIFTFLLINNLPYFFGISEPIPHAPTALVLFLFYFLGWFVHIILFKSELSLKNPIFKPMTIFSIFILISGIITFFRYANFYPFLSDGIYELITNVNGVSSGGAIMSTVFFSLNYLTGFAFFFILLNTVKSKEFVKKILIVLCSSTFLSLCFGLVQHFKYAELGNNPISIRQGLINATFKDALSFGAYLGIVLPLIISMIIFFKGTSKILPFFVFTLAVFILPHIGSRSGFISVIISLFLFLILSLKTNWEKLKFISTKRILIVSVVSIFIIIITIGGISSFKNSRTSRKLNQLHYLYKAGNITTVLKGRWDYFWNMAAHMIKDYPLTGVGIGAYIIEVPNYAEINNSPFRKTDSVENYFLQVWSELGVIGLLFSLWIFWEIFKQINRSLGKSLAADRWKYIQIGISCGIIALFLQFFVHTYIGSYEIKYTFWLLVALVFCLEKSEVEKEKEEKPLFSKNFKIFSVILIAIFGGIHLWNSTHSLSLKSRTEQLGLVQDFGFYQVEKDQSGREFRWTKSYGGTTIKIEKPVIEIPLLAAHPDIRKNPVNVKIYLVKDFFKQKTLLDEITLSESIWKTYEYSIPDEVGEEVILLFKVSRTWNPLRAFGTPDPRNLGVAIGKIQFKDNMGKEGTN